MAEDSPTTEGIDDAGVTARLVDHAPDALP
jgi:hypothetical protein